MKLSDDATEQALYCVNELIDRRSRAGVPLEPWMPELAKLFDGASLTCGMSARGHESGSGSGDYGDSQPESEPESLISDLVGTREAADMLGLSTRQVRRLATRLDAEKVGGRTVFRRSTLIEYAEKAAKWPNSPKHSNNTCDR
ncbi:hypothetical protein FIV07_12205 [Mycobacterium sp. THAF192]|nr:hypothetical protein FIV07_12205 [Mycobacterium sp. THAF192]